ncbi:MAG: hypothetical protein DRQ45_00095 [Gammaproteobacteria bacterium]|nr:MAG: hypothetical protein DRQ45_00095 [Gammaproteobacteria bacterium]
MPIEFRDSHSTDDFVNEAREWLGTPFHHQASVKKIGCDCAGLVKGVAKNLSYEVSKVYTDYGVEPANGELERVLASLLVKKSDNSLSKGDIILFRFLQEPQHLGIYCGDGILVHSYSTEGGVVEHCIDEKWKKRIVSVYELPGLTNG